MDNKIRKMKDYSALASWAIWESNRDDGEFLNEADLVENIDFIKYEHQLQKSNTIFVAMNPGGEFDEEESKLATRKIENKERPWNNFHNVGKSRDYLLAQAIKDTPESGSYMTDFFPIVGSDSKEIRKFVNSKDNKELIEKLVLELDEEISLFLPREKEVRLLCIGRKPYEWAEKFLIKPKLKMKKEYKVFYIPHYSGANNGEIKNQAEKLSVENYYPTVVKAFLERFRNE